MEQISVFDMFEIGVGPSSSHTLGPWKAALQWANRLDNSGKLAKTQRIKVELFGSLSLTGIGHATDVAILMGLSGENPQTVNTQLISAKVSQIKQTKQLPFLGYNPLPFDVESDLVFKKSFLDFHPNGMLFVAYDHYKIIDYQYFYSIGGGFIIQDEDEDSITDNAVSDFNYPIQKASELIEFTDNLNGSISDIVLRNETSLMSLPRVYSDLEQIWTVMKHSIFEGITQEGNLPGGLNVARRARNMVEKMGVSLDDFSDVDRFFAHLSRQKYSFNQILSWINIFALAVNEQNADMGRIVTSPTNGSSGVIPAVLAYYVNFVNPKASTNEIARFLAVAGEIGALFKKGATISAAMGGCQAEIGVSSAMAAAALCERLGGTPRQVLQSAEIAMEHHLGLTCDPIAGLVQIPCIERNTMGAVKAINAAELGVMSEDGQLKVSLDQVIETMWNTAKDMNHKYKETSEGGLAVAVSLSDC